MHQKHKWQTLNMARPIHKFSRTICPQSPVLEERKFDSTPQFKLLSLYEWACIFLCAQRTVISFVNMYVSTKSAAKLRCRRTIVEQSSCCFKETRDDTAHFQATTNRSHLFHIWSAGEQKEHSPPPGSVVAFSWFWRRIQNCRLSYLLKSAYQRLKLW